MLCKQWLSFEFTGDNFNLKLGATAITLVHGFDEFQVSIQSFPNFGFKLIRGDYAIFTVCHVSNIIQKSHKLFQNFCFDANIHHQCHDLMRA